MDLVKQIVSDISARFGFKSMAFCDRSDFAKSSHLHGYSYVSCYPVYEAGPGQDCVMTIDIDNDIETNSISVFSPPLPPSMLPREPAIGEVRFLAYTLTAEYDAESRYSSIYGIWNPNKTTLEQIEDGSFDGWVYPDGSEYRQYQGKYDFSKAYSLYDGSNGRFSVPVLSNFVRMNPGTYCTDAIRRIKPQLGIGAHRHEFLGDSELMESFNISGTISMKQHRYAGARNNDNFLHAANKIQKNAPVKYLSCDYSCVLSNFDESIIYYEGDPDDETRPGCYLTPV